MRPTRVSASVAKLTAAPRPDEIHGLDGVTRCLDESRGITAQMKHIGGRQIRPEQSPCDFRRGALHDRFLHPRDHDQDQTAGDVEDDDTGRRRDDEVLRCRRWQPRWRCGRRAGRLTARAGSATIVPSTRTTPAPRLSSTAVARASGTSTTHCHRRRRGMRCRARTRSRSIGSTLNRSVRGVATQEAWKAGRRRERRRGAHGDASSRTRDARVCWAASRDARTVDAHTRRDPSSRPAPTPACGWPSSGSARARCRGDTREQRASGRRGGGEQPDRRTCSQSIVSPATRRIIAASAAHRITGSWLAYACPRMLRSRSVAHSAASPQP